MSHDRKHVKYFIIYKCIELFSNILNEYSLNQYYKCQGWPDVALFYINMRPLCAPNYKAQANFYMKVKFKVQFNLGLFDL